MLEVCGDELSLSFMLHAGCTQFFSYTHTSEWFQGAVLYDSIILNMCLHILHLFQRFLVLVVNEHNMVRSILCIWSVLD